MQGPHSHHACLQVGHHRVRVLLPDLLPAATTRGLLETGDAVEPGAQALLLRGRPCVGELESWRWTGVKSYSTMLSLHYQDEYNYTVEGKTQGSKTSKGDGSFKSG